MGKNVLIKIEYDGTNFSGWQIQPHARTVQGEIEHVLKYIAGHDVQIHGTSRTLLNNMITGVSQGFTKKMEVIGVGYKAEAKGDHQLDMGLGYSHNILFDFPKEITVQTINEKGKNPIIILNCIDKQLLGQVATKIRSYRKPEPYKGKGIRFEGEYVRKKAGKSAEK